MYREYDGDKVCTCKMLDKKVPPKFTENLGGVEIS